MQVVQAASEEDGVTEDKELEERSEEVIYGNRPWKLS